MKSFKEENLKVLELPPNTTEWKNVKEAYHRLCKKYHPDKQPKENRCDAKLNAKFLAVIHAYYKLDEENNRRDGSLLARRGEKKIDKEEEDDRCYEPGEDAHLAKYTPDECKTKGCSLKANGNPRVTKGKCCNLCSKKNDSHATMCTKYLHYRELLGTKHMDRKWVHKKSEWWYWCDLCEVHTEEGHFQKWKHVEKEHAHAERLSAAATSHSTAPSVDPGSALSPRSAPQDQRQVGPPAHPLLPAQLREKPPPCPPPPTKPRPRPPAYSPPPTKPRAQPPAGPPSSLEGSMPPSSSDIAPASKPSLHPLNATSPSEPCSIAAPLRVLPPNCQAPPPWGIPPSNITKPMAQPPLRNFRPPPRILLSDKTRATMIRPPHPQHKLAGQWVPKQSPVQQNGGLKPCRSPVFKTARLKPPPPTLSVGRPTFYHQYPHSAALGVHNYAPDTTQVEGDQRILTIGTILDTVADTRDGTPDIPNPSIPPDEDEGQRHGTSSDSPLSGDEICFTGWTVSTGASVILSDEEARGEAEKVKKKTKKGRNKMRG